MSCTIVTLEKIEVYTKDVSIKIAPPFDFMDIIPLEAVGRYKECILLLCSWIYNFGGLAVMKQHNFIDTGPGPYQVAPPMCDPMQHGQTQPYPPIVPPQGETKSETVPPSMKTKFRGDGFCRGL
uniref:Uncharacterized protein n=1 Tax=Cucumis sativus TaxID=3659 RepID=A0A0A0LPD8_CUCSA